MHVFSFAQEIPSLWSSVDEHSNQPCQMVKATSRFCSSPQDATPARREAVSLPDRSVPTTSTGQTILRMTY